MSGEQEVVPRMPIFPIFALTVGLLVCLAFSAPVPAGPRASPGVEGQPLSAAVERLVRAREVIGRPFSAALRKRILESGNDPARLQHVLDPLTAAQVTINPESRVKVARGPAAVRLQQAGFEPILVKVENQAGVTAPLRVTSPQAGPNYGGVTPLSMQRQRQLRLLENQQSPGQSGRFLEISPETVAPLTPDLSGLDVEYRLVLLYSSESGKREITLRFDVGQGTQDLGFRGELAVLADIRPAIPVRLRILDHDGSPTVARLVFKDAQGNVYPPQVRRLAPDFFFQEQVYRADGSTVLLPPGKLEMAASRGPEYRVVRRTISVPSRGSVRFDVRLQRWIEPGRWGYWSGDHHIHAAGCAHYTSPTEGVLARDMFLNVKGEGLNVGSILTWGPCYEFQRQFFSPRPDPVSDPFTVVKYDVEVSGFGSQALGHVCLLNLTDQTYPGSDGTKTRGWPTWTTPVLRWAKEQGGVTGYAHSASGLEILPANAAARLMSAADANRDGRLTPAEAESVLLPLDFAAIDRDGDGGLSRDELVAAHALAQDQLPNLAIPEMNGVGAMETCVTTALGLCDFISAMDTARTQEWTTWYHLLNCGFPLKASGETDFPCMSGSRVGQGRVYVHLGKVDRVDYTAWCEGIRKGRSYVSDGYAHALEFRVDGTPAGGKVSLAKPGKVRVSAQVAFGPEIPRDTAHGEVPAAGAKYVGDTVNRHDPLHPSETLGSTAARKVELVVNGRPVASRDVPTDGNLHPIQFDLDVTESSWVALRQMPQLHTNPVDVLVAGAPIRASQRSARWCIEVIHQLWRQRERAISPTERPAARAAFDQALAIFRQREQESSRH